jgi:hypothetical protein
MFRYNHVDRSVIYGYEKLIRSVLNMCYSLVFVKLPPSTVIIFASDGGYPFVFVMVIATFDNTTHLMS